MFDDHFDGREQPSSLDAIAASGSCVQPVRLEQGAVQGGFWCIPGISDEIPLVLTSTGAVVPVHIAAFALKGHAMGVALPGGKFTDPKNSLLKQWQGYIKSQCGSDDPVNLQVGVVVEEEKFTVYVNSPSRINIFRLKPIIERINAIDEKVGWFVYDAVNHAGHNGYPIYQIPDAADFAQNLWHQDANTDAELAKLLRANEGARGSIEKLRETFTFPWPSDLAASVGGHEWMLKRHKWTAKGGWKPVANGPRLATLKEAAAFVASKKAPKDLKEVVAAAISLVEEVDRKDSAMKTISRPTAQDLGKDFYMEDDGYAVRAYGASCIVVWDEPHVMLEAIEHWETNEMEGGESTEVHMILKADVSSEAQYATVVQQLQDLIRHHSCVSRLLKQFPQG